MKVNIVKYNRHCGEVEEIKNRIQQKAYDEMSIAEALKGSLPDFDNSHILAVWDKDLKGKVVGVNITFKGGYKHLYLQMKWLPHLKDFLASLELEESGE
jgi:hypothetical protein